MQKRLIQLWSAAPDERWITGGFWCYAVLFALMPWSVEFTFGNHVIEAPSEPLQALAGLWLLATLIHFPGWVWQRMAGKPLFLLSAGWIAWMLFCTCWSSIPWVSWKYALVETAHWGIFGAGMMLFPHWWQKMAGIFTASIAALAVYTMIHHAGYHFRADQALLAPMPFFPEHTSYAATLCLVLPWAAFGVFPGRYPKLRILLVLWLLTGLFFAYTRAAWLSLAVSGLLGLVWYFKSYRRVTLFLFLLTAGAGWYFRAPIAQKLHAKIAKDVSIRERFNRYACARRMIVEKPWLGFGPGTYQFHYVHYQRPAEMTRISVEMSVCGRSPDMYGRGGGAHSEYWQAATECGWPGLLLFVLVFWGALGWNAARLFRMERNNTQALVLLAVVASLAGFFAHAFANNLMHDARIAALLWGAFGMSLSFPDAIRPEGTPPRILRNLRRRLAQYLHRAGRTA